MNTMSPYCKAYPSSRFREFPGWSEAHAPDKGNNPTMDGESDTSYYFLHASYVVTKSIFVDEDVVFDAVTPEWKAFCDSMGFEIPVDEFAPEETSDHQPS